MISARPASQNEIKTQSHTKSDSKPHYRQTPPRIEPHRPASSGLAYDGKNHTVSSTDPNGLQSTHRYHETDRLCELRSPDTGRNTWEYSPSGRQVRRSGPNGLKAIYRYYRWQRLLSVNYPDASQNLYFSYAPNDAGSPQNPLTMRDPSGNYLYAYDVQGLLRSQWAHILGREYLTSYSYDSAGSVSSITYPSGQRLKYERDTAGRISAVWFDDQAVLQNILRTTTGRIRSMQYVNGLITSREYDHQGRLVSHRLGELSNFELKYTKGGQVSEIIDHLNPARSQSFRYDPKGRLIRAHGPYGRRAYTYDPNDNRLTRSADYETQTYRYTPGTNRLEAISGPNARKLEYDSSGNVVADGEVLMEYNQAGRLALVSTGDGPDTHYTYNGLGQRVIKFGLSSTIVYHYCTMGRLIAETDQFGGLIKQYIWLDGELVAVGDPNGLHIVHTNYRGEPHLTTDAEGRVVWRAISSPFGRAEIDDGTGGHSNLTLNHRLPGQYFDAETGLHYNYYRDYSQELGRYIEPDPIGLNGGMNLYAYCGGDPVNRRDVWGLYYEGTFNDKWEGAAGPEAELEIDELVEAYLEDFGNFLGYTDIYDDPIARQYLKGLNLRTNSSNFQPSDIVLELEQEDVVERVLEGKSYWDSLHETLQVTNPKPSTMRPQTSIKQLMSNLRIGLELGAKLPASVVAVEKNPVTGEIRGKALVASGLKPDGAYAGVNLAFPDYGIQNFPPLALSAQATYVGFAINPHTAEISVTGHYPPGFGAWVAGSPHDIQAFSDYMSDVFHDPIVEYMNHFFSEALGEQFDLYDFLEGK